MSALRRWAACPLTASSPSRTAPNLKLTTEWIMLHGELTKGIAADTNQNPAARSPVAAENKSRYFAMRGSYAAPSCFQAFLTADFKGRASELLQGA